MSISTTKLALGLVRAAQGRDARGGGADPRGRRRARALRPACVRALGARARCRVLPLARARRRGRALRGAARGALAEQHRADRLSRRLVGRLADHRRAAARSARARRAAARRAACPRRRAGASSRCGSRTAMSLKWMWNGAPGSITASVASSADANASTSVNAPSLVACMCAKSSTGRTKSTCDGDREHVVDRAELAHASHHLDAERHEAVLRLEPLRAGRRAGRRRRRSPARARGRAGSPGGRRSASAPAAFASPAVWSSIPSAILNFFPRSTWPMKAASGACTESSDVRGARAPRRAAGPPRSRARSRLRSRSRTAR